MSVCLAVAMISLGGGVGIQASRGAAQSWQAAAAWAQVGVLWQGGAAEVAYGLQGLGVLHEYGLCGGSLGSTAPTVSVSTNLARWRDGEGARVGVGWDFASPDGGGSLYFHASDSAYRVIVRPESGLTVRVWVGAQP